MQYGCFLGNCTVAIGYAMRTWSCVPDPNDCQFIALVGEDTGELIYEDQVIDMSKSLFPSSFPVSVESRRRFTITSAIPFIVKFL